MGTYTQILYQIIYSTKYRERTLEKENRQELYKYICGILKNKNCHIYQVGGWEDHVHIVTHLHPGIALAYLVKSIKLASTEYIKNNNLFLKFNGWQNGYGAFTYSIGAKENLINYVKIRNSITAINHLLKSIKKFCRSMKLSLTKSICYKRCSTTSWLARIGGFFYIDFIYIYLSSIPSGFSLCFRKEKTA